MQGRRSPSPLIHLKMPTAIDYLPIFYQLRKFCQYWFKSHVWSGWFNKGEFWVIHIFKTADQAQKEDDELVCRKLP